MANQPVYVIRGHTSPVHALHFYRSNSRLISADADGWLVLWDVTIRRPIAAWKAHDGPVLAVADWDNSNIIITHGRDHKIRVWEVQPETEEGLDKRLPALTSSSSASKQPPLLHELDVNALNFCAFAICHDGADGGEDPGKVNLKPLLLAVPSSRDTDTIDVYHLPSRSRKHVAIGQNLGFKTGMPMALKLFYTNSSLNLIAGYESGHAVVFTLNPSTNKWDQIYSSKPHTQPVLSLDYSIGSDSLKVLFYSSSADSIIAKHQVSIETSLSNTELPHSSPQSLNTRHAGQQGLVLRSDSKIFATAGWDSRIRVYSVKNMKELAVLKWHKEGCYTIAFAKILDQAGEPTGHQIAQVNDDILTVEQQREKKVRNSHILAAGSKDGRVSLWEVF
ncbi:ASTRA complex subunit [Orbilia ellipsospora]|uniref:ASTRA-associated protein 1 n=1 Tax=Orbilia ellipsospora TaxID=2528407 RepID=A0AAV9XCD7_9PEZI